MNKKQKVAKGAWMVPFILVLMILVSGIGFLVSGLEPPIDGEEATSSITTDKYTYYQGEAVYITITGYREGSSTEFSRGYMIKDSQGNWVRDGPWIITMDVRVSYDPVHYTWNQKYELDYGCPPWENLSIHYPRNGQQVSTGKYYIYACPGPAEPAEIEIIEPSKEPLKITTDKYTYYQGEPVHITITGFRVGRTSDFDRGYLIKDELGNWVRDPPQIYTCDPYTSWGPDNYSWYQKYELLYEYDIDGNYQIHYPRNGEQVSLGKYYIYPYPGDCEPAEIEIIERPRFVIEKVKISGPDEVLVHTYYELELRITVYNNGDGIISSVVVKDVLPAELELLEYDLIQGELSAIKKGKGKMGATHLIWLVGDQIGEAEITLKIATTRNPAGKQEFTSPGRYILNDGASAKGIDPSTGGKLAAGPTSPIYVNAIERIPEPVPVPFPLPSQPPNKNRKTSQLMGNNALGNGNNVKTTGLDPSVLTLLVIMAVFLTCMILTYLEVRFAEHLLDQKLI